MMRRLIKKFLHFLVGLLLLLLTIVVLLTSSVGIHIASKVAENIMPGTLRIRTVSGHLFKSFTVYDLDYKHQSTHIHLGFLHLDWQPIKLLTHELSISQVTLNNATIKLPSSSTDHKTSFLVPTSYHITGIRLNKVHIRQAQNINIHQARGQLIATKQQIDTQLNSNISINDIPVHNNIQASGNPESFSISGTTTINHRLWQIQGSNKQQHFSLLGINHQQRNTTKLQLQLDHLDSGLTVAASLNNQQSHAVFHLTNDQTLSADWQANLHDLNILWPSFHGNLESSGKLTIAHHQINSNGHFNSQQLQLGPIKLHSVRSSWQLAQNQNIQLLLTGKLLAYKQHQFFNTRLAINGTFKHHIIQLDTEHQFHHLTTKITGQLSSSGWQGAISQLQLRLNQKNIWQSKQASPVHVGKQKISIKNLCLHQQQAHVCATVNLADNQWQALLSAQKIPLQNFDSFMPHRIKLAGKSSITLKAAGDQQQLQTLHLDLNNQQLTIVNPLSKTQVNLGNGSLAMHYQNQQGKLIFAQQSNTNASNVQLNFNQVNFKQLAKTALNGELKLTSTDPQPYLNLLPWTIHSKGHTDIDLQINGQLGAPKITGKLSTDLNDTYITSLGTKISHGQLQAVLNKQLAHVSITLQQQGKPAGSLTATGNFHFVDHKFISQFNISGKHFLALNNSAYKGYISPRLQFTTTKDRFNLTGQIGIANAYISPPSYANTITLPNNDIDFVHHRQRQASLPFDSNVTLNLGQDVMIDYQGIKGNLAGQLNINSTADKATTATGSLNVSKGTYSILGATLTLENSQLSYANSLLSNPNLNITASRTIGELNPSDAQAFGGSLTAGVKVTGTLDVPQVTLYANPASLTTSQILSYLLFGNANPTQDKLSAAMQALSLLNAGKGSNLLDKTKSTLGINELGVETNNTIDAMGNTTQQQTSFVVGKYLSPNLYLRYNNGINNNYKSVQLEYFFSKHWSFQTTASSTGTGGDLLYTINTHR